MAKKLFGIDIAGIVQKSLPGMFKGTLTRYHPGTRTSPGMGTNPTTETLTFKGFCADFETTSTNMVKGAKHVVLIIANTCKTAAGVVAEPSPRDTLVLTDDPQLGGKTLVIVDKGVKRDPASATWLVSVK